MRCAYRDQNNSWWLRVAEEVSKQLKIDLDGAVDVVNCWSDEINAAGNIQSVGDAVRFIMKKEGATCSS